MKKCSRCRVELPEAAFNRRGTGLQSWCRSCQKKSYKAHYARSPDKYAQRRDRTRRRIQAELRARKNAPCADCHKTYPYYVMQWDHLGEKEFNLGDAANRGSLRKALLELEKCELVCANCHAERTHSRNCREDVLQSSDRAVKVTPSCSTTAD